MEFRPRRRNDNGNYSQNSQFEKTTINIPTHLVGKVIGRGGSKIRDIQSESGARVNVTKDTDGDQTLVRISGNKGEIDKAVDLIESLTKDVESFSINSGQVEEPKEEENPDNVIYINGWKTKKYDNNIDWKAVFQESDKRNREEFDSMYVIVKNFYQEHPEVTAMTEAEAEQFRLENNNIVVKRVFSDQDGDIKKPCTKFEHAFHPYPEILEEIKKVGFEKPSPIQSQSWPVLLSGEDMIGIAQTGTGKTLAFLLPALIHIEGQTIPRDQRKGPTVLIIAPTRELALQIEREVNKYHYKGITSLCIYGGVNRQAQVKALKNVVDIVIATPGRMNDLEEAGHLNIKYITYVVLDEADRMLDMGFEPQIRKIMYSVNPNRQTVMTSATWPDSVRRLATSYMQNPVQIYVGSLDLAATHTVTQVVELVEDDINAKLETLFEFVRSMTPTDKIIVFCGKKAVADHVSSELSLQYIPCTSIHGDREQSDREQAVQDIMSGDIPILIATDVASRGLDIDDLTHVINFDFPKNIEEYVHRVGRTGRAGKRGKSISYFTKSDWHHAKELIPILEEAGQYVPEEIYNMAERYEAMLVKRNSMPNRGRGGRGGGGGGGGRRW
ncbi:probable ATP-dependent RNA helicase DDX43 [Coccinella septempunctata]|uniref:probable ATP-dependent RNA helicase DDX43 n=1 Tax=Coccinella septempunctata TaxID=41139 RepID=UPI001D08AB16|nr:probable ATP-dependent RNA helicase DDX43 [Coccinella septempunctata]